MGNIGGKLSSKYFSLCFFCYIHQKKYTTGNFSILHDGVGNQLADTILQFHGLHHMFAFQDTLHR